MKSCSIRELLRLALPFGTRLLTGRAGLSREIEFAVSLRATPPAFPTLRGGELVLLSLQDALLLDERLNLETLIRRLAKVPIGALGVSGTVDDVAVSLADDVDLPLLRLPSSVTVRSVEHDVHLLLDRPVLQHERRAAHLYSHLTLQVANGAGIEGVMCTIHEVTDRAVAFYDAAGQLRLQYGSQPAPATFAALQPAEPSQRRFSDEHMIIVKMISTGTSRLGYIALGGATLEAWDDLAIDQAALALALELTKQQAVQAVEARAGGELLGSIVNGKLIDFALLQEQAVELGYDLHRPHIALLIAPAGNATPIDTICERLQHELLMHQVGAPCLVHEGRLLCLYPDETGGKRARDLLRALSCDIPMSAGTSTPALNAAGWQGAYHEAQQALTLGQQLFGDRCLTSFDDLHVYRLLLELRTSRELRQFHQSILGALVDYDQRHAAELLVTLEGYFDEQCNIRAAAERLRIHRNTLIYRLRRIGEIAGIDLEHTETMHALQLALKAHRVLRLPGANGSGRVSGGSARNGSNGASPE